MWDVIVSVPDHCLSFYLALRFWLKENLTRGGHINIIVQ